MKLIIDIDEELYKAYKGRPPMLGDAGMDMIAQAVANGIPYGERLQGDLANEVWELYEKYHSHLATSVLEFGDELKELLGKYQKEGADND